MGANYMKRQKRPKDLAASDLEEHEFGENLVGDWDDPRRPAVRTRRMFLLGCTPLAC